MRDRIPEDQSFPALLDPHQYARPLVLAPHPDDEVYGCGGLLALWAAHGLRARVVLVTGGQAQHGDSAASTRLQESLDAAEACGWDVEPWGLPDRSVRCNEDLIARLTERLISLDADVVLAPALCEPHPDHQALCLALACAMARLPPAHALPDVLLYESGGALTHATAIVDITPVMDRKDGALSCFASQESLQPYKSRIQARDHFRALTLGPAARAAEVFHRVACRELGWPAWVPAMEPLFAHSRGQAALPADLPLVSVLVRTMGDAHLPRTLASVMAQTYPRIEAVVVAAHARTRAPADLPSRPDVPFRWVCTGQRLSRPEAANAALDAASGDLLIFLDDDDLWSPEHVHKLVSGYQEFSADVAVHTDVQVIGEHGQELIRYDQPFSACRLAFTNVLPIHSVLFERRLVRELGCRFDPTLPVLEDWDFWLQVARQGEIRHVPGVSAFYRWQDRSGLESDDHRHQKNRWRDKVQARWLDRWPQEFVVQATRWYASALDTATQKAKGLDEARQALDVERARGAGLAAELQAASKELERAVREGDLAQALALELKLAKQRLAQAAAHEDRAASLQLELELAKQRLAQAAAHEDRASALQIELHLAAQRLAQAAQESTAAAERASAAVHQREELALELARLEGAHREQASHLASLNDRLSTTAGQLQAQRLQTEQLQQGQDLLRAQMASQLEIQSRLMASTSWRITRPLRWIGALLRGTPQRH